MRLREYYERTEDGESWAEHQLEDPDGSKADHLADVWEQQLDSQW